MKALRLIVELTYDTDLMHGADKEAEDWFINEILKGHHLSLMDSGDLGDEIGQVRVIDLVDSDLGSTSDVSNPPKSATIEDKLNNILRKVYDEGYNCGDGFKPTIMVSDLIYQKKQAILAIITTETTKAVDQKLYELAKMKTGDMHQELQKAYNRVAKRNSRAALQKEQNQ